MSFASQIMSKRIWRDQVVLRLRGWSANWMPLRQRNRAVSRFTRTEKIMNRDAKRSGVGPAVIARRVRSEAEDYTILRSQIGAGDVPRQFEGREGIRALSPISMFWCCGGVPASSL